MIRQLQSCELDRLEGRKSTLMPELEELVQEGFGSQFNLNGSKKISRKGSGASGSSWDGAGSWTAYLRPVTRLDVRSIF